MSVCILQNLEKYRVLWTDFLASCREINRSSVAKIGPEPAKPTISLALVCRMSDCIVGFRLRVIALIFQFSSIFFLSLYYMLTLKILGWSFLRNC